MKRLFLFIIVSVMVLTLTACGNSQLICEGEDGDKMIFDFEDDEITKITMIDDEGEETELEEGDYSFDYYVSVIDDIKADSMEEKLQLYADYLEALAALDGEEGLCELK